MKVSKSENILLAEINTCLQGSISAKEREIMYTAKRRLEKKEYFPAIIDSLQSRLTPLAIRQELSDEGRKIYRELLNPSFANNGFGHGLISIFGVLHK